ncbi:hypothetical protein NC652_004262 [Populus alba x Populus x berolinensis]|nr:hypothetical protein NC652_004262 [Populus alba x Populus x berolinensis]
MSDLDVQTPTAFDPFADANAEDSGAGAKEYVHIRTQQRNGRKSLTTVQGLKKEFSYNKILKDLKKEFCCNGTVVQDLELGQVIQLQGDQRKNVSTFLVQVNHDGKIDPGFDFKNERTSPAVVASLSASDTDIVQPLKRWKWEYTTFQEAVNLAPDKSKRRFVIYVKSWIYEEKVEVAKKNKNGMIAGEGMDFTTVTGSLGVLDGSPTFRSASLDQKSNKLWLSLQGSLRQTERTWSLHKGRKSSHVLYYGESSNREPGAGVSKRVNQPGYHVITDPNEAKQFTVAELIQGEAWLESTGVSFTQGL